MRVQSNKFDLISYAIGAFLAFIMATTLALSQHQHANIYIVGGQSNAKATYAAGISEVVSTFDPDGVIFHTFHSGNRLDQWVSGTNLGNFSRHYNYFEDYWSVDGMSHLEEFISDYGSWDIVAVFWFQGEGDSGSSWGFPLGA